MSTIPLDLTFEILLRLPAKSVLRFRYVSKTWCSIIRSKEFIDAFMSLSLSRPRLVFAINDLDVFLLYSPHQNSSFLSSPLMLEKDSLTWPPCGNICNSVRGFICCYHRFQIMVCNLTTRQVIPLAKFNDTKIDCYMYLGYNPNNDQYKVLRLMVQSRGSRVEHSVLTLGGQQSSNSWRPIKTSMVYYHFHHNGVCIDGVVYYVCDNKYDHVLSSFDVGSEQIRLIETPKDWLGRLINYLGRLAVHMYAHNGFTLLILENQSWSKKRYIFQPFHDPMRLNFTGITAYGEIVYALIGPDAKLSESCEFLCYHAEKKVQRRVRFEGFPRNYRIMPPHLCSYVDSIVYL